MKAMTPAERKIARRMLDAGEPHEAVAERLGRSLRDIQIYAVRLMNLRKCRITTGGGDKSQQPCWRCQLASGRISSRTGEPCPWVEWKTPVPGWRAESIIQSYRDGNMVRKVSTYEILTCPLFEEDQKLQ